MDDGILYPTAEHAFQAQKILDVEKRRSMVEKCKTAKSAKAWGRRAKPLREGWNDIRLDVMRQVVRAKFMAGSESLRSMLMETGDRELVEGNVWNDTFWGVSFAVRDELLKKDE
ncbi:hypothetical protein FOZ60_004663 [Perkinsus olseni]|uniref:NADAR domain-containing protein n=1 Tax=Perkinsus olseni TaxID=32597 RepID=A0A7J6NT44_PEROL|nr:hypothetical protein FOZ60_004663 [Perkinsus olseni]